jgi:hypothetical protein
MGRGGRGRTSTVVDVPLACMGVARDNLAVQFGGDGDHGRVAWPWLMMGPFISALHAYPGTRYHQYENGVTAFRRFSRIKDRSGKRFPGFAAGTNPSHIPKLVKTIRGQPRRDDSMYRSVYCAMHRHRARHNEFSCPANRPLRSATPSAPEIRVTQGGECEVCKESNGPA